MSSSEQPPPVPPTVVASSAVVPAPLRVTRRLKRIAPLSVGTMSALLYGSLGLIFLPFLLLFAALGSHASGTAGAMVFGVGFAIAAPLMYAAMGFIIGVIGAALYNFFAKWTGGVEVEVE